MVKQLETFKSVFRGREDVFAVRWEKEGRAGYTPAYDLDWAAFRKHKENGGSLKNFADKKYAPLTDARLSNHLTGKEIVGIYPLLPDNTCCFIAADFDEAMSKSWLAESRAFMAACRTHHLPVYLERSRSGEGGHVWLFFEQPWPAVKARKIFGQLLTSCGIERSKTSSFDRLFPNQDHHSCKELGNLIALPLQKTALEKQNACFIDPMTEIPFPDQWAFLTNVQKANANKLEELYRALFSGELAEKIPGVTTAGDSLHIILDNHVIILRQNLPGLLHRYLRDSLNFLNDAYFIKKNTGSSTFGTDKSFRSLDESPGTLVVPRGFAGKLIRYCKEQKIEYVLEDRRAPLEPVQYSISAELYPYQQEAVAATKKKDFGVIVSPPGSGKTVMGLAIVAAKKQPALILVHRKQLFDQWVERIQAFLGIPSFRIGKIEGGCFDIGHEITVAMIQSLQSEKVPSTLYRSFGTIIVDECHHMPAKTFSQAIGNFHTVFLYGFTATPVRKNNDEKLIFIHLGDVIHEVLVPANLQGNKPLSLVIRDTGFSMPFNPVTDKAETLIHVLVHDTVRNKAIVADILREVKAGRKVLVLTERIAHVEILHHYLKASCEVIMFTGDDKEASRRSKFARMENGEFQVVVSTGQFIGEGMDIQSVSCLVLAYPFSFEGKLVQYIGRVQRSPLTPVIYDYRDAGVGYLENLFRERNKYYRKLLKSGNLSKFDELVLVFRGRYFYINETDQLLEISCLELPFSVERFVDEAAWKIRVIEYDDGQGKLFAEILDYGFPLGQITAKEAFYFYGIENIRFRNIDTGGLLRSVVLAPAVGTSAPLNIERKPVAHAEHVLLKTMKVPLWKVSFLPGAVSFPVYIEELWQDLTFEIANPDVRPEFEAIREYFSRALKKKLVNVEIAIRYDEERIISANATSGDIDSINSDMVDTVRFQFVRREVLKTPSPGTRQLHTLEELPAPAVIRKLFPTDQQLIDDLLEIKKSKHYLHLKYLSSKHEARVLRIRFVLQPFSFLFLLAGEKQYHIVWETLDTEEATYLWSTEKTREALKRLIDQIETELSEIQTSGRQEYTAKGRDGFSRIMHDYQDAKKGFVAWKGQLDGKIV